MCMADSEAWLIRGTRVVRVLDYILNSFPPPNPTFFPHSSHPDLACLCLYCAQTSSWFLKSGSRLLLLSIRSSYRQQSVSGSFFLSSSCLGFLLSLSCFGFLLLSSRLGFFLSSIPWLVVIVVVFCCCYPWHVCHRAGFLSCIMRVVPTSTFVLSLSLVYFHQSCHVIDVSSFYHVIFSCVSSPVFVSSFHLCLMSSLLCISCLCIISCPCVISSYLSCHFSLFPPWTLLSLSRLLLAWILC